MAVAVDYTELLASRLTWLADGQRFLVNTVEAKPAGPITLVVN
jgi:hypothetical protein